MAWVGVSELLILLLSLGSPLNQLLGLPPGERDPNLVHAAPADSLLYVEWAFRGEGKAGAPGIDGLVADPEVVVFFDRIKLAIESMIARNTGGEQVETFQAVPGFVISLTGKPGCLFWGLDTEGARQDVPPQLAMAAAVRAGLVVNAGDEADAITDSIKSLIAATTGLELDELDRTPLPLPAPVLIHRHNNYIILAVGPNAVDDIIDRLADQDGGISNHQGFAAGWKDLGMQRCGLVTFLDIESGVLKIGELTGMGPMIDQGMQMAGIDGVKSAMSVTGVADGQVISRGYVKGVAGDKGLMALVSGRGIKPEDFALVPDDSDVVFAFSADARKILDAFVGYVGAMDPNAADEISAGYEQFGQFLGIDFENDVFASLDHVITVSNSPGDGGWIGSSPVLTVGIKNPRGVAKTSTKIAEAFQREFGNPDANQFRRRGITVERREFMETEISMINIIGENDVPIAPAWCLTETHVMIALHPQALKSRLRRLAANDWKSFGEKFAGGPEGDTVVFTAVDVPSILPQIYGFIPWFGQIAFSEMQSEGFDMNLLDLPSAAAVLPYMTKSRSYLVRTPDGLSTHAEGPAIGGIQSLAPILFTGGIFVSRAPMPLQEVQAIEALEAEAIAE